MNPFSGFLQPQNNRPLQGLATTQDLLRTVQGNKEMAQRQLENTQQNNRANANLKLQQDYQTHSFEKDAHGRTVEEQKQIEGLLAEYQDAEDKYKAGDPGAEVRMSRATQMLKRFGMDVSQGQQTPNLRAMTGEQALPTLKNPATAGTVPGNLSDFRQSQPIDNVASEELKSRAALQARNAAPEQDLSQEEFEKQLIENPLPEPSRYEENGKTTDEYRKMVHGDEPETTADSDDGGVIDLDAESQAPLQIGSAPQEPQPAQPPRRLSTQLLPTVISKGGKQLYESTGPSGRWSPMVQGVFEPFLQNENPEIGAAAKRAQQMSSKLIEVDGVAPKDAIKMGMDYLQNEATRLTGLERTKIGSRRLGGGGAGTGLMGKTQDIAESAQIYDDNARTEAAKIQEEDRQYESIEAAASSGDPALQRDAVNQLLKIRSGSAVTASEDARISQINGLIAQVQDRLGRWTGGAMTPEMARTIQQIVSLKRQVSQAKIKRIYDHQAKLYQAQNRGKTKDPSVLDERANVIREGANVVGADPNENLYK